MTGPPALPCPGTPEAAKGPEPLCMREGFPLSSCSLGPRQPALPCQHRSYGLMRQSSTLPLPRWDPRTGGLCRLRSAPAGRRTFPTLSLRICACVLGPLPRRLLRCLYPLLPSRHRPSPRADRVGAPPCPGSDFSMAPFARLQRFSSCAGPQGCSPPRSLLPRRHTPHGSRGLYVRASRGSFPPHAPDMLAVRSGQWTAEDFHLIRCAALSAAPRTLGLSCCWKRERGSWVSARRGPSPVSSAPR